MLVSMMMMVKLGKSFYDYAELSCTKFYFSFFVPGVHFNTSYESLKTEIFSVLRVFSQGVEAFYTDPELAGVKLSTSLSCEGLGETAKWAIGERFFRYLKNVTIDFDSGSSKPSLKFNQENALESVELQIMNLRPGTTHRQLVWEQVSDSSH